MKSNGNDNKNFHNEGYGDNFDVYENDANTINDSSREFQTDISKENVFTDNDNNENEIDIDETVTSNSDNQEICDNNSLTQGSNKQGHKNGHGNNHNCRNQKQKNSNNKHKANRNRTSYDKKSINNKKSNDSQDTTANNNSQKTKNFGLRVFIFFFISIMWLEISVKSAADISLTNGLLTTMLSTIPLAFLLTLLCSFSKKPTVNHIIAIILQLILSLWYCLQIIYYNLNTCHFMFANYKYINYQNKITYASLQDVFSSISLFLFLVLIPLIFLIFFGTYALKFNKTTIAVKTITVLLIVIIFVSSFGIIDNSESAKDLYNSYDYYSSVTTSTAVDEEFGIFALQRIDIAHTLFNSHSADANNSSTQDEIGYTY